MKTEQLFVRIIFLVLIDYSLISVLECKADSHGQSQTDVWVTNMVPDHYDAREVPIVDGVPAKLKLFMRPWTIGEISLQDMHFFINLYVGLRWVDHRLNIPSEFNKSIFLPGSITKFLWLPSLIFRNCMACEVIQFNRKNDRFLLQGKELSFMTRVNARLFCNFNIANYPMDSHWCSVEVQSARSTLKEVILIPNLQVHTFLRPASLPQFTVQDQSSGYCSNDDDKSGTFLSCVEYKMKFVRNVTYHVMLTYCPCILIVLLSWISFWLDVDLAAPRVALGLTSLLTLSTQFSNAQKDLPPVSYVKAVDIWFIICMFMVFLSLVEFAVCYTLRRIEKKKNEAAKAVCRVESLSASNPTHVSPRKNSSTAFSIDIGSRIAFPVTFLIFNVCYWIYYGSR